MMPGPGRREATIWGIATELGLPTPFLAVHLPTLQANIADGARRVLERGGVALPHFKTHKCPEVAALQQEHGAVGATVATIAEAQAAHRAGFGRLLVAYPPVGTWRLSALAELSRTCDVAVACTQADQVAALADTGGRFEVYWEIDCGTGRLGSGPGSQTVEALARCTFTDDVRAAGLMTFAGHAYAATSREQLLAVRDRQDEALLATRDAVRDGLGIDLRTSVGVTPLSRVDTDAADEFRYGNYVFHDATQVAVAGLSRQDCALTVVTTVVDVPDAVRVVLDCGAKSIPLEAMSTLTQGYGLILDQPDLLLSTLFEEHGLARSPTPHGLRAGQRVAVVPNHACTAVNLHGRIQVVDDHGLVDTWPTVARR